MYTIEYIVDLRSPTLEVIWSAQESSGGLDYNDEVDGDGPANH